MADNAYVYLAAFSIAFVGIAISQNLTVFFNATGRSRVPFYSNLIELPINVLLSWLLIHGHWGLPALGLAGAALGSGAAIVIRCGYLYFKISETNLWDGHSDETSQRPKLAIRRHFSQAFPIAANFITMLLSINVCMMLYARLGVHQFAALTLLFPWMRVAGNIVTAWAQATGISVGQILGREGWLYLDSFVSRAWRVVLLLGFLAAGFYAFMFYLFEFIYPDLEAQTLNYLWDLMPILLFLPLIRSSNTICGHVLRAFGEHEQRT
jgi:Na+-driven multidrug efflux pump